MSTSLPKSYRRIVANKLSSNFREVTSIEEVPLPTVDQLPETSVVVRIHYAGVNASDVNYIAGRYDPGAKPPFYPGFEALGSIIAIGKKVPNFKIGQAVAITSYGCFSEIMVLNYKRVLPIPVLVPEVLPLLVGGLTASIALEQVGEIKRGQTVLVTAAAGGTGHFAVQVAKLAGCHVIGTCSTDSKVEFLKKLGCDRVINYKKEDLFQVLKKEYPKGIDVVYESVGGSTFDTCVNNLAIKGKLIVIGFISGYQDQSGWTETKGSQKAVTPLSVKVLQKSTSIRGFFLNHYAEHWKRHTEMLTKLMQEGKLHSHIDDTATFNGIESVPDAVDYMYQGKNIGKLVVTINPPSKSKL